MSRGARFSPRRVPIRWRITLWYTILMTVLVVAVLFLLFRKKLMGSLTIGGLKG